MTMMWSCGGGEQEEQGKEGMGEENWVGDGRVQGAGESSVARELILHVRHISKFNSRMGK